MEDSACVKCIVTGPRPGVEGVHSVVAQPPDLATDRSVLVNVQLRGDPEREELPGRIGAGGSHEIGVGAPFLEKLCAWFDKLPGVLLQPFVPPAIVEDLRDIVGQLDMILAGRIEGGLLE